MSISRRSLLQVSVASAVMGGIGAPAEAPAQPVDISTRFRSWNYRDRFVRHRNFQVELDPVSYSSSELDQLDATFLVREGLEPYGGVSFEARNPNLKGYFLRHQDFRLVLHKRPPSGSPELALFRKDATWQRVPGRADRSNPDYQSFVSVNFPRRFIRHRNFHLFLDEIDEAKQLDRDDATFIVEKGFKPL